MRIPKVHFGFGIKTHLLGTADVRYDEKWDYLAFSWDGTGYHRAELGERANWIDSGLRCFDLVYFFLICFASRFHVLFSLRASSVLLPSPVPLSSSPRAQCCSSGTAYGTTFSHEREWEADLDVAETKLMTIRVAHRSNHAGAVDLAPI